MPSFNDTHKPTLIITERRGTKTVFLALLKKKTFRNPQMIEKIWKAKWPFITAELDKILFTNFKVLFFSRVFHFLSDSPFWWHIWECHCYKACCCFGLCSVSQCQWQLLRPVPEIILCQRRSYCTNVTIVPSMIWVAQCTEDDVTVWQNAFLLSKQFKPARNCLSKTKCQVCVMAVADNSCQSNACIVAHYT